MEVTTTLPASISTPTLMLKRLLISATRTTESGQPWPLRVSLYQANSLLTEPFLSTAVRFGTFNQCQFHTHQLTQIREPEVSLTWLNSSDDMI